MATPTIPVKPETALRRALVVYEANPDAAGGGRLFELDPTNASGVPLPAFRPVLRTPAAGSLIGEAVLNVTTGLSYVWDGATWVAIVPPSIVPYATDQDVLADSPAVGTYAFSRATGNLFVRFNNGTNNAWREIGTITFPDATQMAASTIVADGSIAYVQDTQSFWVYKNNVWTINSTVSATEFIIKGLDPRLYKGGVGIATDTNKIFLCDGREWKQLGVESYADTPTLLTETPPDGTLAYVQSEKTFWAYTSGLWHMVSILHDTEANILRLNAAIYTRGVAVSTDTSRLYVSDGTNWIGQPFTDYTTEALLLAATPPDGTMAVAKDTGMVFYYTGGNWKSINRYAMPNGAADPAAATSAAGDLFYNTTTKQTKTFDGTNWVSLAASQLSQLSDVDFATAPNDKETLVFDATSNTFKPGKGGSTLVTGAEPAAADRSDGMMWWDGVRLWIWNATPGVWVQA